MKSVNKVEQVKLDTVKPGDIASDRYVENPANEKSKPGVNKVN